MSTTTISAGGIAPLADGVPAHTDRLVALSFTINDRPLVRLIPEKLNQAETLTLGSLGVSAGASRPVGAAASRAVGFPAWPIINDPDNAHHALNLVGDLEWARRNAQNNAKRVKERFDALVVTLTSSAPHFVPTLLEELARIFYGVGNVQYARQYFGKAREVERAHGLPVDNDRHQSVFVEFAVAGVVGARELTAEASAALERSDDPADAFDYMLNINAERIRAGVAPYAFLPRDMRKIGKAAGLSADDVDDKLFDSILGLKGFDNAPAGFFNSVVTSLSRYARTRPDAREILLSSCPDEMTIEKYLTLLDNAGALVELRENKDALAAWVINLCENVSYSSFDEPSPRLINEILAAGTALQGQEIRPEWHRTPLSVLDALAEFNVVWKGIESEKRYIDFSWSEWFNPDYDSTRRSLSFLADDSVLAPQLAHDLSGHSVQHQLGLILAHEGAKKILLQKIDMLIDERKKQKGSVPENSKFLTHKAEYYAQPELYAAAPERLDALFSLDAAEQFQAAMNMGILAELTWPLFEQEYARLAENLSSKDYEIEVFESYPAVSLVAEKDCEIIDGDQIVINAEMPAQYGDVDAVRLVGSQAVVTYDKPNRYRSSVFWTGSLAVTDFDTWFSNSGEYSLPINDTRLTGSGVLTENSATTPGEGTVLSADVIKGPTFIQKSRWADFCKWNGSGVEKWDGTLSEMLQELGIYSDYNLDFSTLPASFNLNASRSTFIPVQPTTRTSLFGSVKDVHISLTFSSENYGHSHGKRSFIVSSLGTFSSASYDTCAAIRRPGGGVWLTNGTSLWDPESDVELFNDSHIHLSELPLAGWHQLRPADEDASTVMRSYTLAQAKAVMNGDSIDRETIAAQLGTANQRLIDSVVKLAESIRDIDQKFSNTRMCCLQQSLFHEQVTLTDTAASLLNADTQRWYTGEKGMLATLHILSELKQGNLTERSEHRFFFSESLAKYANNERKLIGLLGSPLLPALFEHDNTLSVAVSFVRALVDAKILGYGARLATLDLGYDSSPWGENKKNVLPVGTVIDGCLIVDEDWDYDGSQSRVKRTVWVPDDRKEIAGYPVLSQHYDPLSADEILACLDAIEHSTPERSLLPETQNAIANGTGLSHEAVTYLFGGLLGISEWESNFLTKEQRAVYGFTIKQSKGARRQIRFSDAPVLDVLAAAVPADNPISYITEGPDAQGVVEYWKSHHRVPAIRLSSEEFWDLGDCFTSISNKAMYADEDTKLEDNDIAHNSDDILRMFTVLAASLPLDDSRRPLLASKLEWLRTESARIFAIPQYKKYLCDVEFGAPFDDSRFAKAKTSPRQQSIRVLLEGHLDSLIADLKTKYTTTGSQWDPEVSVPELVQQVMQLHALSTNAARYFLQLLALAHPTDANIRAWNGWKKKDIDTASAELLDKGLIVEAKRSGAGRSRFLPGGWLPGSTNNKPMEVWKAPHYLLWQADMVQPAIEGCPVLMPAQRLFKEVWERYTSGDVPGYEELKTTRYRSRRR
ncbi:hypothetical protein [Corynebacterium durum]|uniref:hypothetical protein n=1 Tax=Corynebacterium durum TaxID=61592 RepID=UPI0028EC957D|nr:hypothetical protein [Corynebacterium durum]